MVDRVKYTETMTDHFYDITKPVTYGEDDEACNMAIEWFSEAIGDECERAFHQGWTGWNRPSECTVEHLTAKMKKAFSEGDVVKVGVYLMMLYGRGVTNFEHSEIKKRLATIGERMERLIKAEEVVAEFADVDQRDPVWSGIRTEIDDLDRERKRLLKKLGSN